MNLVRFHPEAEAEMIEAAAWYEKQQADLGKRFLSTVQDSLNRAEEGKGFAAQGNVYQSVISG